MRKILPILLIILSIVCVLMVDFDKSYNKDEYDLLKDQVELISWIFASLMAILSFFGLFIGFIHENKLVVASKILKELYLPYTITVENIRQNLINYKSYLSNDRIIKFIYYSFLIVSCISIIIWGTAVGFYTKFKFLVNIEFTVEALINIGIYIVFLAFCVLLVGVTIILKSIILHKNPLGNGYLPSPEKVIDVDYLSTQKMDLDELFIKTSPVLEFYKNPPFNNPKYDVNITFPIKWNNMRFIIKMFNENHETVISIYGKNIGFNNIGEKYTLCLEENLPEELYEELLKGLIGEMKIYDKDNKVLSRLSFSLKKANNDVSFIYGSGRIILYRDKIDLDIGLINDICENEIEFRMYTNSPLVNK